MRVMTRRRFLATTSSGAIGAACGVPAVQGAGDAATVSLGLVADPQYADAPPLGTRFYRQSPGKLAAAVAHFNTLDLACCVNLGDFIDHDWASFDPLLAVLAKSRHPFHHVLGNHDFEVADDEKGRAPGRLGLTQRYYAVERGPWCFVMLDTNDVSLYAHPERTPAHAAAQAALRRYAAAGVRSAQSWNGAVGEGQLGWLEATCTAAAKAGRRVVVCAHHPVLPDDVHNAWNAARLLEVVDRHRNVVAWLNGHNHAGAFAVRDGVPFLTLKGMVETESTNAFAVARLHPDRLELIGHGREPSREVGFRRA